jgi:putative NADH-flavin reductase
LEGRLEDTGGIGQNEKDMRFAVFGATGRTGRQLLIQTQERGLHVSALARRPEKLKELLGHVVTIEGTVADPSVVERVVSGCDVVLSVLGRRRDSPPDFLTTATANMIDAMRREGARRLVILTDTGVEDPSDRPPLTHKILRIVLRKENDRLAQDSSAAAMVTADSEMDWTLVRSPILTDGPKTGRYKVGALAHGMPLRISRADVAEFMLSCAIDGRFIHERPVIGGGRPSMSFLSDVRSNL